MVKNAFISRLIYSTIFQLSGEGSDCRIDQRFKLNQITHRICIRHGAAKLDVEILIGSIERLCNAFPFEIVC